MKKDIDVIEKLEQVQKNIEQIKKKYPCTQKVGDMVIHFNAEYHRQRRAMLKSYLIQRTLLLWFLEDSGDIQA